ncbi:MAG: iron complex transport system ATP-binding protein, partial [Psychromonas sp.]
AIHDLNFASRFCPQMIALHQGTCVAQGATATTLNSQLAENMFNIRLNRVASKSGYDLIDVQYIA